MRRAIWLVAASACAEIAGVRDLRDTSAIDGSAMDAAPDVAPCPPGICAPVSVGVVPDDGEVILAADGVRVFAATKGQVLAAPASGGAFESLIALVNLHGLAVDDDLFASAGQDITRCLAKKCDQPTAIVTFASAPTDLAVSGQLFFLAGSQVWRVARTGGTVAAALDEHPVAWTVDSAGFTFTRADGVYRCPSAGCAGATAARLADATAGGAVATTSGEVFWVDGARLRRIPLGPPLGAPSDLATTGLDARSLVVSDNRIYWREGNLRVVARPRAGGAAVTLASNADAPVTDLASDHASIYWMTSDRRVLRLAK
jgi:hypothetical protein